MDQSTISISQTKWQRLSEIVNQQTKLSSATLSYSSFKKMFAFRILAENVLVFLLQYSGLMFSTLTPLPSSVWFAAGTSCGFIFLRGPSILPGIALGTWAAYLLAHFGMRSASGFAILFSLQAFLLLKICYNFISPTLLFYQTKTFISFLCVCTVLTGFICLGFIYFLTLAHPINIGILQLWLQWYLADLNGILIVSCALITWDTYFPQLSSLKAIYSPKLLLLFFSIPLLVAAIFISHSLGTIITFLLLHFFIITIISFSYGWCGAIAGLFSTGLYICVISSLPFIRLDSLIFTLPLPSILLCETFIGLGLGIRGGRGTLRRHTDGLKNSL